MTGPIDRAYVEILPDLKRFNSETRAGIEKSMSGVRSSVDGATKQIKTGFRGAGTSASTSMRGVGSSIRTTTKEGEGAFARLKGAGKEAFSAIGGAKIAGMFAVGGIIAFGKTSGDTYARIAKETNALRRVMGGSVKQASEWRGVMELAGVSADQFQVSVKKLSQEVVKGSTGKGAFPAMGIAVKDANGHLKPLGDLLPKIADKFKDMAPGAVKNALAVQLFGRSGLAMLPFLNRGASGMEALRKKANDLGIVLGDKDVKAMADSVKSQREATAAMEGLQIQIGRYVLPAIDKFVVFTRTDLIPAIRNIVRFVADVINSFHDFVVGVIAARRPIMIVAGIITVLLLPSLIRLGIESAVTLYNFVTMWSVIAIEAIQSAVKQVAAFVMVQVAGFQAAGKAAISFGIMIAKWVWMGVQALINAAKVVLAWAIVGIAGLRAAAEAVIGFAIMVAKWVWLGAQSLLAAAKVALAWLIAMGPISLVIIAVVGLVALIVLHWKMIERWTSKVWHAVVGWITGAISNVVDVVKKWWPVILIILSGGMLTAPVLIFRYWRQITGFLRRVWNDIWVFLKRWWPAIVILFSGGLLTAPVLIYKYWSQISGFLGRAWRTAYNTVVSWIGNLLRRVHRLPGDLVHIFDKSETWLISRGAGVIRGLWAGIKSLGTWIWNNVKSIVPGWIKSALGIHSPPAWAVDAGKWIARGLANGIKHFPGFLAHLGDAARKKLASVAAGALKAVGGFFGGGGGMGNINLLGWILKAINLTGVGTNWLAPLQRRISFESGGNPNAINLWDSNAKMGNPSQGLMQVVPTTFRAYALPGYDNNIRDPVSNIVAAIRYINSRYGSIFAIDPPVQGYKGGAWDVASDRFAYLHKREMVMPAKPAEEFRRAASSGGGGANPREIASAIADALAGASWRIDADGIVRLVTKGQNAISTKGVRRG